MVGLMPNGGKYALAFGVWAGITELIPYIGPWLGAMPPVVYALVAASDLGALGGAALPRHPAARGPRRRAEGDGPLAAAPSAARHLRAARRRRDLRLPGDPRRAAAARRRAGGVGVLRRACRARALAGRGGFRRRASTSTRRPSSLLPPPGDGAARPRAPGGAPLRRDRGARPDRPRAERGRDGRARRPQRRREVDAARDRRGRARADRRARSSCTHASAGFRSGRRTTAASRRARTSSCSPVSRASATPRGRPRSCSSGSRCRRSSGRAASSRSGTASG